MLRCVTSAVLAYLFALHVHLPNPVWAPVSALVVSQERLDATHSSVIARFIGTLCGVVVALTVHEIGKRFGLSQLGEVGITVAVCAIYAKGRPGLRVCLWTGPLVLLSGAPGVSNEFAALCRAAEVLLGAGVAGLLHLVEEHATGWTTHALRLARAAAWRARRA